jgi:hypothetical protein
MTYEISPEEEAKLNAEVEAFKFGMSVGTLRASGYPQEAVDHKVEQWKEFRSSLPPKIAAVIMDSYREGYYTVMPKPNK